MKKFTNIAALVYLLIAMVFALTACNDGSVALAAGVDDDGIVLINDPYATWSDDYDVNTGDEYDFYGWDDMPNMDAIFNSVTGEVVSIYDGANYGDKLVLIEGEYGSTMLVTDFNTFFMGGAPEVGDTVTGIFVQEMFMAAIYPPHHNTAVVVNVDEIQEDGIPFVFVSRFNELDSEVFGDYAQLISTCGELVLTIGYEGTEVILQSGETFDGDIAGRKLVVTYARATFSIPPQTTPIQIVVLYERAVTGPEFVELPDDWEFEDVEPWYCIVVDGEGLVGPRALFMDEEMSHQTHVELMPVAEYLGAEVAWNHETDEVTLEGRKGSISFIVGSNDFTVNGEAVTLFHASEDFYGMLVVPVLFFRDVFGMASAYSFEGRIYISSTASDMQ